MKSMNQIHQELKISGFKNSYVGWSALRQLPHIVGDDEEVLAAATGWYEGGIAVIVATSKRILFLDKKPISFKIEDIHYEVVSDVQHKLDILVGRLNINSASNQVEITSFSHKQIKKLATTIEANCNNARLNLRTWGEMWTTAQNNNNGRFGQRTQKTPLLHRFQPSIKK